MVALAVTTSESPSAVQLATPPADPLVGLEVDQRQLDERIYDALKEKILQSELAPGTALTIRSVAQRLGVSVTPVRDALRRLQAEGLVQMQGRGETTVAQLEPGEIDDILDLRLALELHATRRGVTSMSGAALKHLEGLLARQCGRFGVMRTTTTRLPVAWTRSSTRSWCGPPATSASRRCTRRWAPACRLRGCTTQQPSDARGPRMRSIGPFSRPTASAIRQLLPRLSKPTLHTRASTLPTC